MANLDDIIDFIILELDDLNMRLNPLKLQKLLYYAQAWHLAFHGEKLFNRDFEAWAHGPVCRAAYDRFRQRGMYDPIEPDDARNTSVRDDLPDAVKDHLNGVLEVYGPYSGAQLEELTHGEAPWREARKGIAPDEASSKLISNDTMRDYYAARVS